MIAEVFNLFNAKNPSKVANAYDPNTGALIGKTASAFAGSDALQPEQRLAQIGLRIRF